MAKRGDAAELATRLGANGRRRLTAKQVTWLRDVATREHQAHRGEHADATIFFEGHGIFIKDADGRDHANLRRFPNGAGTLELVAEPAK